MEDKETQSVHDGSELLQLYRENHVLRKGEQNAQREVERLNLENAVLREQEIRLKETNQKYTEAEEQIEKQTQELAKLRDQVSKLDAEGVKKDGTVSGLNSKIKELEAANQALHKTVGDNEAKNLSLQNTMTALKSTNENLQKSNESLRIINQLNQDSLRECGEKVTELEKRHNASSLQFYAPPFCGIKRAAQPIAEPAAKRIAVSVGVPGAGQGSGKPA